VVQQALRKGVWVLGASIARRSDLSIQSEIGSQTRLHLLGIHRLERSLKCFLLVWEQHLLLVWQVQRQGVAVRRLFLKGIFEEVPNRLGDTHGSSIHELLDFVPDGSRRQPAMLTNLSPSLSLSPSLPPSPPPHLPLSLSVVGGGWQPQSHRPRWESGGRRMGTIPMLKRCRAVRAPKSAT
jgi:hypothetical protein